MDSHSQYEFAIYHGNNLISWTSWKQKVATRASTEAQYRALAYTGLIWVRQLMSELHILVIHPPLLLCDNVCAIFMTKNPVVSTHSKHIALDFHFIREHVEAQDLTISNVASEDQLTDIFTKALPKDHFFVVIHLKLQVRPSHELAGVIK